MAGPVPVDLFAASPGGVFAIPVAGEPAPVPGGGVYTSVWWEVAQASGGAVAFIAQTDGPWSTWTRVSRAREDSVR